MIMYYLASEVSWNLIINTKAQRMELRNNQIGKNDKILISFFLYQNLTI